MLIKLYKFIKKVFYYIIIYPSVKNTSLMQRGKIVVLNSVVLISLFSLIPLIIQTYIRGNHTRIFFTGSLLLLMFFLFITLKITKRIDLHINLFLVLITIGCLFLTYIDGYSSFGILLIFPYPLIVFFLIGSKKGLVLNFIMYAFQIILLRNIILPFRETWYPIRFSTMFIISYFFMIITSFIVEKIFIYTWDKLEKMAFTDKLTKLPNRFYLYQYLNQLIKICDRSRTQFSVFFLDLDNFKQINDTLGHNVGDHVLVTITERLKNIIRSSDIVARFGGDEFVIIMMDVKDEFSPAILAAKILSTLKEGIPIKDSMYFQSLSIGIANYPKDGTQIDELFKKADIAMYNAKSSGRDGFKFYNHEQDKLMNRKIQIENNLRNGLINNEFRIVMQPKINTMTEDVSGVEALLRWNNPQLGEVRPDIFIPIAEGCGIINSLGFWAFKESIRIFKELKIVSSHNLKLAVNLSPIQLHDNNFVSSVLKIVEEAQIDTESIEFEITEGVLLDDNSNIKNALDNLTDLGFHLAIDDFGTGYCSLNYLKRFNVNTLKIDKSFIQNMLKDKDYLEIVKVIISMANIFGLLTVAEGVEEIDELNSLKNIGCDQIQGYYFSKPLENLEIIEFMREKSYLLNNKTVIST